MKKAGYVKNNRAFIKISGTFMNKHCEIEKMSLIYAIEKLLSYFVVNCFLPVFIFFLVLTLAMKERDSNLKIKETLSNLFRKIV